MRIKYVCVFFMYLMDTRHIHVHLIYYMSAYEYSFPFNLMSWDGGLE